MVAVESVTVACRLTPPDLSGSDGSCLPSPTPLLIEQLKQELCSAADNNDENLGITVCNKLEKLNLTKECLEATRVGGVVNDIRKKVQDTCPKLSVACRTLIKQWRKQTDTYARAGSSCGGSNGVTPSMASPAMRRLLTPQTPHRLADGSSKSQVSSPRLVTPLNGSSTNLVAQAIEKVQGLQNGNNDTLERIALKRRNDAVPEGPFKRSKSALIQQVASPQLSLSAVRRDAQSTAELVAQLSENLPEQLAPDLSAPKSNSVSPNTGYKISRPQQTNGVNQEEKREKRKYTKRAAKFFKNESDIGLDGNIDNDINSEVKSKTKRASTTSSSSTGKKVDWYASIPSIEELEQRAAALEVKSKSVTKPYIENVDGRELICLPFVELGIPDVDEYEYPAEENPKIECHYPRAARYALKGL